MSLLQAPWREQYLVDPSTRGPDVFDRIIQSGDDSANHVVLRARTCLAVLNKYPYSTAHVLVVPYKLTGDLADLIEPELAEIMAVTQRVVAAIRAEYRPDGFNVGFNLGAAAGAGIHAHVHLHVVPRWTGDHNFMTVVAGTRVHPSDLDTVWRRLHARLQAAPSPA